MAERPSQGHGRYRRIAGVRPTQGRAAVLGLTWLAESQVTRTMPALAGLGDLTSWPTVSRILDSDSRTYSI